MNGVVGKMSKIGRLVIDKLEQINSEDLNDILGKDNE